jgi:aryl-alcohol dehydrogenase-like predicted oxidoreductase
VIEPRYNLLERKAYAGALQSLALRENLGVVPYFALANGLLTGKYRSIDDIVGHAREPFLRTAFEHPHAARVIATAGEVAAETGVSMVAVAIAWMLAQPGVTAPIASVSRPGQLEDIIAGTRLELDARQLVRLDRAGD